MTLKILEFAEQGIKTEFIPKITDCMVIRLTNLNTDDHRFVEGQTTFEYYKTAKDPDTIMCGFLDCLKSQLLSYSGKSFKTKGINKDDYALMLFK